MCVLGQHTLTLILTYCLTYCQPCGGGWSAGPELQAAFYFISSFPFLLAFDVGGLGFEFCVFVAGGVSGLLLLLLLLLSARPSACGIINKESWRVSHGCSMPASMQPAWCTLLRIILGWMCCFIGPVAALLDLAAILDPSTI